MSVSLIIGGSGLVGGNLLQAVVAFGSIAIGTYRTQPISGLHPLNICEARAVQDLIHTIGPSVIYLPAAVGNVDSCELNPEESYRTNVLGLRNVVLAANNINAKLVYFSSDYIFDGIAGNYQEDDPPNPICEYGRQKLLAEHYIATNAKDWLIIRTNVIYGWERQGKNFLFRVLDTLKAGKVLSVPSDQIASPTYAPQLASLTVELVKSKVNGVYHIAGKDRVSRLEFAKQIASSFGLNTELIRSILTKDLKQPAPRPLNAGLCSNKLIAKLGCSLKGSAQGLQEIASATQLPPKLFSAFGIYR